MKRCRDFLHLSQAELAERVGCSTTTIARIESLERFASARQLDRIAKALRVPHKELFTEDSPAIKALEKDYEVRERLKDGVNKAIDEALNTKK